MKRREFMKRIMAGVGGIATQTGFIGSRTWASTLPASTGSTKAESADPTTQRLNVIVHGTFAIIVDLKSQKPAVYLKAPNVNGHVYRAQSFTLDPKDPTNVINGWSMDYQPNMSASDVVQFDRGVPSNFRPRIGEANRIVVDVTNLGARNPPFWTVKLPVPDDIWPLRATPYNYFDSTGSSIDTYHRNEMHFDQQCPIIYILTYANLDPSQMVIFSGNQQNIPFDQGIGRLHFFAEPVPVDCNDNNKGHLRIALNGLDNLFDSPLTLSLISGSDPDTPQGFDDDTLLKNYPGVLLCEERSLQERNCFTCSQIQTKLKINTQYQSAIQFIKALRQLEIKSLTTAHQKKRKKETETEAITVPGLKPPSNCMSIICVQS